MSAVFLFAIMNGIAWGLIGCLKNWPFLGTLAMNLAIYVLFVFLLRGSSF